MRMKVTAGAAILVAAAVLAGFALAGCNQLEASPNLHGRWVAGNQHSFEFANGRFTRVTPGMVVRRGSFTTDGGFLTLRFDNLEIPQQIMEYRIEFPRLLLMDGRDLLTFFHDSPVRPEPLYSGGDAYWAVIRTVDSTSWAIPTIFFGAPTPQRGAPWILEGDMYSNFGGFRGRYTITSFHGHDFDRDDLQLGRMTLTTTHIGLDQVFWFVNYRIPTSILHLYDWEDLLPQFPGTWPPPPPPADGDVASWAPEYEEFWQDIEAVRWFFLRAEHRAGANLYQQGAARLAYHTFFGNILGTEAGTDLFDYSIERYQGPLFDFFGDEINVNDVLTMRMSPGIIFTFTRLGR